MISPIMLKPDDVGRVIRAARGAQDPKRPDLPGLAAAVVDGLFPLAYARVRKTPSLWARSVPRSTTHLQALDPMPAPPVDAIALFPGERKSLNIVAAATTSFCDDAATKPTADARAAPHLWPLYGLIHLRSPIQVFLLVAGDGAALETLEGQCKLVLGDHAFAVPENTQQIVAVMPERARADRAGRVRGWVVTPGGLRFLGEASA
jgi:hypothetical protein